MITDFETNTLFFANSTNTDYLALKDYLKNEGVQIFELEGTKDIWARDYMPIQVNDNKFVKFAYEPNYLLNDTYRHTITPAATIEDNCKKIGIDLVSSPIKVDGGNVIKCDDAVIMTDKIFSENSNYTPMQLVAEIERLLECEVLLIPFDKYEGVYGHADGVLRYLGNNELLLAEYGDDDYLNAVKKALGNKFAYKQLHIGRCDRKNKDRLWSYINYIQTKNFIILPALTENGEGEEDVAALEQFRQLFPTYNKKNCIIQAYALPILKMEGGLHCCSWNVKL